MSHMTWGEPFFEKWVIAHYSRMKSKFENLKPYNIYFNYADFKFLDQNLRSSPSFEKLSPTFFGTSNFETWLSRDPITWHPEVRCFRYKMTHFIILPPQKMFSRTLQILGFIVESGHSRRSKFKPWITKTVILVSQSSWSTCSTDCVNLRRFGSDPVLSTHPGRPRLELPGRRSDLKLDRRRNWTMTRTKSLPGTSSASRLVKNGRPDSRSQNLF